MSPAIEGAESGLAEPAAPLSPDDDFYRLRRLLQRARGFTLALVSCNLPVERDRFIERIELSFDPGEVGLRVLRLSDVTEDLHSEISALGPMEGQAVAVTGFERSIPSRVPPGQLVPARPPYPTALDRLNRQRELFRDLPCPVILFLPDYAITRLVREAPDFWAWRSAVFEIGTPAAPAALVQRDPTDLDSVGYANLSAERKRAHVEVLRGLLEEEEGLSEGHETTKADLLVRISFLLLMLGEMEAARDAAAAVDLGRNAGEAELQARALDRLADVLHRCGELDEALRIRQQEELPVYEKLGDVRSRAITLGKIADIYYRRGDLDEALRVHQEEELPVYEKLGDQDSIGMTLWKVARVDLQRKQYGVALERLMGAYPVLLRIGRLDGIALAGLDLGQLLCAAGQVGEGKTVLQRSRAGFEKLGQAEMVRRVDEILAQLPDDTEEPEK